LHIKKSLIDNRLKLTLTGELDHHAARIAMRTIGDAIDQSLPRDCFLDLAGLSFMDSSGIAVVLNTHKRMTEIDGRAFVINVPRQPMKVLMASGIYRIVEIAEATEAV